MFEPGDKVVCIDTNRDDKLKLYNIYTIKEGSKNDDKLLRSFIDKIIKIEESKYIYTEKSFKLLSEIRKDKINKIIKTWE